jgi:hypothetical protein
MAVYSLEIYVGQVNRAYDDLLDGYLSVPEFVEELKRINVENLEYFAENGFRANGGMGDGWRAAAARASGFINSFADNFGQAIEGDFSRDWRWRALLYPNEGWRMATVLGQQAAMRERGAKSWQRRLHPELSRTGPCEDCVADSMIVHSMDEPFELLHVNDVCDVEESIAYYVQEPGAIPPGQQPMVEMPVPGRKGLPEVIQMLKDIASGIGRVGSTIIRRVRG